MDNISGQIQAGTFYNDMGVLRSREISFTTNTGAINLISSLPLLIKTNIKNGKGGKGFDPPSPVFRLVECPYTYRGEATTATTSTYSE